LSSILRALKKLEKEAGPAHQTFLGPGMAGASRQQEKKLVLKGLIIFAALLLIAAGVVFLAKKPSLSSSANLNSVSMKSASNDLSAKKADTALMQSGKVQAGQAEDVNVTPATTNHPFNESTLIDESTQSSEETGAMDIEDNETEAGKSRGPSAEEDRPAESESDSSASEAKQTEESTGERMISPSQQIPKTRYRSEEFSEIDESLGLELQAISWASDPKKSIAVINNRVCREKETVNGFTVQQIDDDDVIVSNGAIMGKLLLKIR
jgi:hypothetical protein